MRCQVHSRPQTTKAMTTTATAMLAAICKLRRSSYQPLCLKMPRKKSPNPRSKPRPRAVFINDSRKNAPDNPAQTSASEPGKPWYWARRQATAVHRPNRQGTVSTPTRKTTSVIVAVFRRNKIARDSVIVCTKPIIASSDANRLVEYHSAPATHHHAGFLCWRGFHPLEWQLASVHWSGRAPAPPGARTTSTACLARGRCALVSGLALDRMGGVGHGPIRDKAQARYGAGDPVPTHPEPR